jgi:hypothetical protein
MLTMLRNYFPIPTFVSMLHGLGRSRGGFTTVEMTTMHFSRALRLLLLPSACVLATCVLAACLYESDRCIEDRSPLAYDATEPGYESPRDTFAPTLGERTGTITWLGGGELGQLVPDSGESPITFTLTHDEASAEVIDRIHEGGGRLACIDSLTLGATLALASNDGALQEQVPVTLTRDLGTLGDTIVEADLSEHDFQGTLSWTPAPTEQVELFIRMIYPADAAAGARGWLIYADPSQTTLAGNVVTIAGEGRVLAEWVGPS